MMKRRTEIASHEMVARRLVAVSLALAVVASATNVEAVNFPTSPVRRCAPDAVLAGTVCLDKYEASVWRVAKTTNALLVRKIQAGRATRADLVAGGATQLGVEVSYAPCASNGQNCTDDIYAVSLPGELPSRRISWFQAQEACANSGKRLPMNAEWQVGANGAPDPGPDDGMTDCNSATGEESLTGARSNCVSARGAFDMVGNLAEWTADWVPLSSRCPGWVGFSDDAMCLAGASEVSQAPGVLVRGGSFSPAFGGETAGPFSINSTITPAASSSFIGFRCAR